MTVKAQSPLKTLPQCEEGCGGIICSASQCTRLRVRERQCFIGVQDEALTNSATSQGKDPLFFYLIIFRGRGRERERRRDKERKGKENIDVRKKPQLVASWTCPNEGSNRHPRYVA